MLTNEDLQAISGLITSAVTASEGRMMARMDKIDARLDNMDARLDNMDTRLDNMDARLGRVEHELVEVKDRLCAVEENTEVTRGAVNALVEWAEQVAVITKAPFPVQHQPVVEP
ncbi:hypothetical protein [Candidatus Allofournierella excrementavium]|uniref:hypothetical protein n=1 Tax=Candidatus Allofournierella excrementavium TaxID=2838591 RepID=UPI003AB6094D